jgi:thioredoxin 1
MKIQVQTWRFGLSIAMLMMAVGCERSTFELDGPRLPLTEVSAETFEDLVLKNNKPVIVDFWAPWCPPCKKLMPVMERFAADYEGQIAIVKVNTDEEKSLEREFNIQAIPRLIYFKNGEVVIEEGSTSPAGIEKEIQAVLKLR